MNQVTCSLCDMKIDELQWKEHLISTKQLQNCKEYKGRNVIRFFDLIFSTYHNRSDIHDLKNEKALNFWQSYFEKKLPKEKFDILSHNSNNKSELEASLTSELLYFMNNCKYDFEDSCFDPLDKIIFCRTCIDEVY